MDVSFSQEEVDEEVFKRAYAAWARISIHCLSDLRILSVYGLVTGSAMIACYLCGNYRVMIFDYQWLECEHFNVKTYGTDEAVKLFADRVAKLIGASPVVRKQEPR